MNPISTVISALLFERDTVVVPGLGMFIKHYDGAKVNVITNHFEKPSTTLSFDPQQRGEDGILAMAMAENNGTTEDEAQQTLNQFVADCFAELKNGKEVELEGLGTLSMDDNGQLSFIPDNTANFNGDAFGLGDFTPTPVYDSKKTNEYKPRTHAPIDDEIDAERDFHRHRRRATILTILSILLVIPAVLILLYFLEIVHFDFKIKPRPVQVPKIHYEPDSAVLAQMVCYYPLPSETVDTVPVEEEPDVVTEEEPVTTEEEPVVTTEREPEIVSVKEPVVTTEKEPEKPVVEPTETFRINIIGGCFSQQENAEKLVSQIREEGFERAYVLVRGKMYYVSYGGYATLEEAKEVLAKVKAESNNKAWILNK